MQHNFFTLNLMIFGSIVIIFIILVFALTIVNFAAAYTASKMTRIKSEDDYADDEIIPDEEFKSIDTLDDNNQNT